MKLMALADLTNDADKKLVDAVVERRRDLDVLAVHQITGALGIWIDTQSLHQSSQLIEMQCNVSVSTSPRIMRIRVPARGR